jgi:hypothetical protein
MTSRSVGMMTWRQANGIVSLARPGARVGVTRDAVEA